MNTKDNLITQLKNLGLKSSDTVMLHASMRAIGKILGGPDQIHQAIMETILPEGTLMMYVGCEPEYEVVGRGKLSSSEETLFLKESPAFDPNSARARRDYGILAEFFRSWPGVRCSENPGARIAALGGKADWIVSKHPLNYGYGPESPLAKLYEIDGKILLLGSDLDQITLFHYAEHMTPINEKRKKRFKVPMLINHERIWCNVEEFDTSVGIRKWPDRFFETVIIKYFEKYNIKPGLVGHAKSYLVNVKSLVNFAVKIFLNEAENYSC
jgi:aminoglycoside 3-N-acetyltransferase